MISVKSLDALKHFLRRDKAKKSLSVVRFINVNSAAAWHDVKSILSLLTNEVVGLSEYCAGDVFPNLRRLRRDLRQSRRTVCVLPLAEPLRLKPDSAAEELNLFLDVKDAEPSARRIYFPLYQMKPILSLLSTSDVRRHECLIALDTPIADAFALTIIQDSLPPIADDYIRGIPNYLDRRAQDPGEHLTLYTQTAHYLRGHIFADEVTVIADAFSLLQKKYSLPPNIVQADGDDAAWQKLAVVSAKKDLDFAQVCRAEFGGRDFSQAFFANYSSQDEFKRWLLWLHARQQATAYTALCARNAASPADFIRQVYETITRLPRYPPYDFEQLCTQRRELLSLMKAVPPKAFLDTVRQLDKLTALRVLTALTHAERLLTFEILQRCSDEEFTAACRILPKTFPALAAYLSCGTIWHDAGLNDEQREYFLCYRQLKVQNKLTEKFWRQVQKRTAVEGTYHLAARAQILNDEYTDRTGLLFVDALGAEYLGFIAEQLIPLANDCTIRYRVARCNLPSVTELNKDFLRGKNVVAELLELDTLKHSDAAYPENILAELNFLSGIKERICLALETFDKVILCSDHGASRLAVLARQTPFDTAFDGAGRTIYKHGRYADALPEDAKRFPTAVECANKIIFADYARFIQRGAPRNEIHGGASLEEVLVPLVLIERKRSPPADIVSASKKRFGAEHEEDYERVNY